MFNLLQVTTLLLYFHRVGISFAYNKSNKQVNQILIDNDIFYNLNTIVHGCFKGLCIC